MQQKTKKYQHLSMSFSDPLYKEQWYMVSVCCYQHVTSTGQRKQ